VDKPLQTTLADAIRFLDQHQIPYALIGGLAASMRGEPRVTADVDAVIGTTVEDATELIGHLEGSAFEPLFPGVDQVVQQAFILPLRHRETGLKVDLSIGLSGFEQQLIERAESTLIAGESVRIATAEDLIVMKLLAGRPRDMQDVQGIAAVRGEQLDWAYCQQTAIELGSAVDQDLVIQVEKLKAEFGPSD
jgi:hypothetical protein